MNVFNASIANEGEWSWNKLIQNAFDRIFSLHSNLRNFCLKARSEKGFGFQRSGLKTGVENDIFWPEIGSGFGETGGTLPPKFLRSTPPHPGASIPVVAMACYFTHFEFPYGTPCHLNLKQCHEFSPPRGRLSNPSSRIPRHIPLVGLRFFPWEKQITHAQSVDRQPEMTFQIICVRQKFLILHS